MDSFIDLFQLGEDSGKEHHHPTSLNGGLKILKVTADFMKEIEVQARARAHKDLILGYETNQGYFLNATLVICQDQVNFRRKGSSSHC